MAEQPAIDPMHQFLVHKISWLPPIVVGGVDLHSDELRCDSLLLHARIGERLLRDLFASAAPLRGEVDDHRPLLGRGQRRRFGLGVQPVERSARQIKARPEQSAADDLMQKAHGVCPYSKATRGNIDVTLTLV